MGFLRTFSFPVTLAFDL